MGLILKLSHYVLLTQLKPSKINSFSLESEFFQLEYQGFVFCKSHILKEHLWERHMRKISNNEVVESTVQLLLLSGKQMRIWGSSQKLTSTGWFLWIYALFYHKA